MTSHVNTEGSEIGDFSDRGNLFRLKSTADKGEHQNAEQDSALLRNLIDHSIESKREDRREDPAELQNCFTNALNMALSQAPIQQRSYPQLTKHQV